MLYISRPPHHRAPQASTYGKGLGVWGLGFRVLGLRNPENFKPSSTKLSGAQIETTIMRTMSFPAGAQRFSRVQGLMLSPGFKV